MDKKTIEELVKQGRAADRVDKERAELMQALVASSGWKVYSELLASRIQVFGDAVLMPATSIDQCIGLEGIKGAMRGLLIARDLPSVIIEAMKELQPKSDEDSQ